MLLSKEAVEAAARALCTSEGSDPDEVVFLEVDDVATEERGWQLFADKARAALEAVHTLIKPVASQVRGANALDLWETCTPELYEATRASGRYNGFPNGALCDVRALCVLTSAPQSAAATKT